MIGLAMTIGAAAVVFMSTVWMVWSARRSTAQRGQLDEVPACPALAGDPTDAAPDGTSWTALDDHQLIRLLRDSSPDIGPGR